MINSYFSACLDHNYLWFVFVAGNYSGCHDETVGNVKWITIFIYNVDAFALNYTSLLILLNANYKYLNIGWKLR